MIPWLEASIPLSTLLLLNAAGATGLTMAYLRFAPLRRSSIARLAVGAWIVCGEVVLLDQFVRLQSRAITGEHTQALSILLVGLLYAPLAVMLMSKSAQMSLELYLMRVGAPDPRDRTIERFRRHFARVFGSREERLLVRKRADLAATPDDPQIHRDLMEIYLNRDDVASALYHAYSLVELLPAGHAHQLALYRLAQILADRLNHLDWAQPHLRRIIRLYPRTFAASYARRLVNQYEAYADWEA